MPQGFGVEHSGFFARIWSYTYKITTQDDFLKNLYSPFWEKSISRLRSPIKVGTQNMVKYASNQKNKATLFCLLFPRNLIKCNQFLILCMFGSVWSGLITAYFSTFFKFTGWQIFIITTVYYNRKKSAKRLNRKLKITHLIWIAPNKT